MNTAVLGAGNGSCAVAFNYASNKWVKPGIKGNYRTFKIHSERIGETVDVRNKQKQLINFIITAR